LLNQGKLTHSIIGDEVWVRDTIKKKYLDPLGHAIESGISSVAKEEAKIQGQPEQIREGMS
jgi:hypothetical protein